MPEADNAHSAASIRKLRQEQCCRSAICVVVSALLATLAIMLLLPRKLAPPGKVPEPTPATPYLSACSAHAKCKGLPGDCCPASDGVLNPCCDGIESSTTMKSDKAAFHGVCYNPAPAKNRTSFPTDDYMGNWASGLWSSIGAARDDLGTLRQMNFKVVRIYGNDPQQNHIDFLTRCKSLGIKVIVAMSDYPYIQDKKNKCGTAPPYDCFNEVRQQYIQMLNNGFVQTKNGGKVYHEAIEAIILINEPELKITYDGKIQTEAVSQGYYAKVMLSALDGALSAEKDMKITGYKPPFTVVHSFSACASCKSSLAGNKVPEGSVGALNSLGYFYDFVTGALKPELFGYTPVYDLKAALQNRWALSFNTQDTSDAICTGVLKPLKDSPLGGLPVFIGEYKASSQSTPQSPVSDFKQDFTTVSSWLGKSASCDGSGAPIVGVNIFEFQVSYFKTEDLDFGIFELGSKQLGETTATDVTHGEKYPVWCLRQKRNNKGESWAQATAEVMGGKVPDDSNCPADPGFRETEEEAVLQV